MIYAPSRDEHIQFLVYSLNLTTIEISESPKHTRVTKLPTLDNYQLLGPNIDKNIRLYGARLLIYGA